MRVVDNLSDTVKVVRTLTFNNLPSSFFFQYFCSFGITTDMKVVNRIHITSYKYCTPDRHDILFGEIDLSKKPLDDSPASQIVLNHVEFVKIKFENSDVVYEAAIYNNRNLDEMTTPDKLYVELSGTCVQQLHLTVDEERSVQLQFVLERKLFEMMRQAVGEIRSLDFLFPPQNSNPALM